MIVEYALPKVWSWVSSQSEWINVLFASYSSPLLLQVYKTKKLWFVPLWKNFQIFMEDTLLLSLIFKTNFSKMIIFLENYKISFVLEDVIYECPLVRNYWDRSSAFAWYQAKVSRRLLDIKDLSLTSIRLTLYSLMKSLRYNYMRNSSWFPEEFPIIW